eukprot:CAMPEP_0185183964 /NCGR_PEP_ID=MMETSP1140-20130426/2292_1 /TAXON_ID=298111 /ORGANISM="Pavlova sp., Strain CCMP459" /LENGTH=171 /DNA_ID=CAMNT_0027750003 /DNA_START=18 /DNA_END=533 /DNA_ORIENTATION=-
MGSCGSSPVPPASPVPAKRALKQAGVSHHHDGDESRHVILYEHSADIERRERRMTGNSTSTTRSRRSRATSNTYGADGRATGNVIASVTLGVFFLVGLVLLPMIYIGVANNGAGPSHNFPPPPPSLPEGWRAELTQLLREHREQYHSLVHHDAGTSAPVTGESTSANATAS